MTLKLNPEAREVYRAIREEIKRRLVLEGSSTFLDQFEPTGDVGELLRRQNYLREQLPTISPEIGEYLSRVRPIRFKRDYLHDRVLLVDEEEREAAEKLGLCDVSTNPEEVEDYPLILSTVGYGFDVELSPSEVAPELYIMPLWENAETLRALAIIGKLTGRESVAVRILRELEPLREVMEKRAVLDGLEELIAEKERELNDKISEKLERFSLTLSGRELLEFLNELKEGNYEAIFSHFGKIEEEILDLINRAEDELSERLGLRVELFSREEIYPLAVPPERVEALRAELERQLKVELYMRSREILERVRNYIPALRKELSRVHELDFLLAVRSFTEGFVFPEFGEGLGFVNGRHLFIENPQPVSYTVGRALELAGTAGERVVILTGANSGGKTSLLELITQVSVLAHMGLPVPAEKAVVEPLDEIFFFRRKRSAYGAGAFETALRSFVRALRGKGRKLILIDEFEAITEPGAAVRIIGELLKIAHEKGFYVVIVSHLGEDLKKELPFARVDGIEAKGLDEKLNLIVDRQPKFGRLGRSTPELIVERLAKKKRGKEREIFERVLGAFRDSGLGSGQ